MERESEVIHQDTRGSWSDPWHIGAPARSRSWALTEIEGESYTPIMAWTEDGDPATIDAVEAAIDGATDWEFHETRL